MKIKITEKPYFGKYFKKIKLQYKPSKKLPKYHYSLIKNNPKLRIKYLNISKKCLEEQKKLLDTGIDFRISIPYNSGLIFIYYNDDSIENYIGDDFQVIEKCKPIEKQEELQTLETNSLIRKNYFFSKYKYRLHFNLTNKKWYTAEARYERKEKYDNIVQYFLDTYKDEYKEKVRIGNVNIINPILYVTDEEDVFYLKLLYEEEIIKIDMVILIDDVV